MMMKEPTLGSHLVPNNVSSASSGGPDVESNWIMSFGYEIVPNVIASFKSPEEELIMVD
jgi:hypothetical protein